MWFAKTSAQRTGIHTCTYKLKPCANLRTINRGEFELAATLPYAAEETGDVKMLLSIYQTIRSHTTMIFIVTAVITSKVTLFEAGELVPPSYW
jgi:hypothetical protein